MELLTKVIPSKPPTVGLLAEYGKEILSNEKVGRWLSTLLYTGVIGFLEANVEHASAK